MKDFYKKICYRESARSIALTFIFFTYHLSLFAPPTVAAHTFHTSLTRMDYRPEKKLIEITLRVFNHDLVPLLESQNKMPVNLEKTPGVDKMILAYLNQNYVLKDKNGVEQTLKWVGKEMDVDSAYIYVEIPGAENPDGFSLKNTLFFETFEEQSNHVNVYLDGKKASLVFLSGDQFKTISGKAVESDDPPKAQSPTFRRPGS